jgi:hypothetical protein
VVGAIAFFMLSYPNRLRSIKFKTALIGLVYSTYFTLETLWIRKTRLTLVLPYLYHPAWVLLLVILLQAVLLLAYILLSIRDAIIKIANNLD